MLLEGPKLKVEPVPVALVVVVPKPPNVPVGMGWWCGGGKQGKYNMRRPRKKISKKKK